ncbi:glucose-1-phosphate adenylyltransferase [Chengkuizengella axinellae]|uniref:Glucose-1-phosphate adenylyltransferase n=1 Tax=Chengkuizengella axinellae TaxID=3064388 RepID=A0ABT9IX43_9BACL|nr:glucose-1-phosphate adenylyltransferase [Chengkuizengella sp. 2205SS18-9]MDP5273916.1 glucose-1-phosphate adenylyltransferase [Chengkuizengella sp. 2205SS18-9]
MRSKECVAMLLAGGKGNRLGALTSKLAKPAVYFGGKYRLIDFTLSNCTNSGIDTVGVLTQYHPLALNSYIGVGKPWDLEREEGGVTILPPYIKQDGGDWYKGTADSIYQNIDFIEQYDPKYVLVISGDHIYKMNYELMLNAHIQKNAEATVAAISVGWKDASRFGIIDTNDENKMISFFEKPKNPRSNLASMGIYIFNWGILKKLLISDAKDQRSSHDFGKDIIPKMLENGNDLYAYSFEGYWRDVGTVESLWETHMDLLKKNSAFDLNERGWKVYSRNLNQPSQYISSKAIVRNSLVNEGCTVFGEVENSVLSYGVHIEEGSNVKDSVIMPNVKIGKNVKINRAIIGEGTIIHDHNVVGNLEDITLIGHREIVT